MSQSNKQSNNKKTESAIKKTKGLMIASGIFVIVIAAFFIIKGVGGSGTSDASSSAAASTSQSSSDITITKSDITEKASFITYQSGKTEMEIIAVKAPDGTIRTALNTCQVCYDSGRGYYVQEGSELVCQNCSNRFKISQIEKEKNGCNPVPILEENKTDDGQTITIDASFLTQNTEYFSNWKK